jgi:hypothetical protein
VSYRSLGFFLMLLGVSSVAHAEDCYGTHTLGGCFATLGVTGPAESGPFRTLSLGSTLPAGSLAVSVNAWRVSNPAELVVSSSDPAGRTIDVVSQATIVDLRAGYGLGRSLDLTLGLPVYTSVKGAGSDAIATQKPAALSGMALGDVRLGLRSTLLRANADTLRLMLRNEWTLPTGDQAKYAGDVGVTATTALTATLDSQGWAVSLDAGYRAAPAVRFGDVRLGSAAIVGAGVARDILERHVLSIGLEAWAAPVLVDSPKSDMANDKPTTAIPAQWLINAQLRPRDWQVWFWAGAGGAFALSSRATEHGTGFADEHFVAPSSARLRLGAGVGAEFDVISTRQ